MILVIDPEEAFNSMYIVQGNICVFLDSKAAYTSELIENNEERFHCNTCILIYVTGSDLRPYYSVLCIFLFKDLLTFHLRR